MPTGRQSDRTRELWKERYRVMRECGVDRLVAQEARCVITKFREAILSVGRDPAEWPHLNVHLGPGRWTTTVARTERAEWKAWAYRALKAAGMGPAHAVQWCRSEVAFHYALAAIGRGDDLPLMPGEVKDKHAVVRGLCLGTNEAMMSAE